MALAIRNWRPQPARMRSLTLSSSCSGMGMRERNRRVGGLVGSWARGVFDACSSSVGSRCWFMRLDEAGSRGEFGA